MIIALMLLPLAAGILAFIIRSDSARRSLLLWTARLHFLATALIIADSVSSGSLFTLLLGDPLKAACAYQTSSSAWFAYDSLGLLCCSWALPTTR
jgi:hypothetical protein